LGYLGLRLLRAGEIPMLPWRLNFSRSDQPLNCLDAVNLGPAGGHPHGTEIMALITSGWRIPIFFFKACGVCFSACHMKLSPEGDFISSELATNLLSRILKSSPKAHHFPNRHEILISGGGGNPILRRFSAPLSCPNCQR
jgi:hypothetical protein